MHYNLDSFIDELEFEFVKMNIMMRKGNEHDEEKINHKVNVKKEAIEVENKFKNVFGAALNSKLFESSTDQPKDKMTKMSYKPTGTKSFRDFGEFKKSFMDH